MTQGKNDAEFQRYWTHLKNGFFTLQDGNGKINKLIDF